MNFSKEELKTILDSLKRTRDFYQRAVNQYEMSQEDTNLEDLENLTKRLEQFILFANI
jgi:hypothetical protein